MQDIEEAKKESKLLLNKLQDEIVKIKSDQRSEEEKEAEWAKAWEAFKGYLQTSMPELDLDEAGAMVKSLDFEGMVQMHANDTTHSKKKKVILLLKESILNQYKLSAARAKKEQLKQTKPDIDTYKQENEQLQIANDELKQEIEALVETLKHTGVLLINKKAVASKSIQKKDEEID